MINLTSTNYIFQLQNSSITKKNPQKNMASTSLSQSNNSILENYLEQTSQINKGLVNQTQKINSIESKNQVSADYKNDLRALFKANNAKILAIIPRTFNAKDKNGNEYIDGNEKSGTFLNAIDRLDEIKAQGFNTLHVLPINPPGQMNAMGTAGSVYAPLDLLKIDPALIDKNDKRTDKEQFKAFVDACHSKGLKVMVDMPSCASLDLYLERPELMAHERNGLPKTPQGWFDIRMFQPWEDEGKRTLNNELLDYHKKFVDLMQDAGVDGIRADVARAKPVEFWDELIPYSHRKDENFAWLAESYTYEDASPQANMPYDRPEDLLRAGFDSYYGQYHIFHEWKDAKSLHDYVIENLDLSYRLEPGKSLIASFATHDDISPMYSGGKVYCNLISGLEATLPMTNPYFVDGFQSGDYYKYSYKNKHNDVTKTDNHEMTVHDGKLDIFNLSRKPGGEDAEIGDFMTKCFEFRDKNLDIISKGSYIILNKSKDKQDQVIAFVRHYKGKTLLVLGNKNVNRNSSAIIEVPTLKKSQPLKNLLPMYGKKSQFQIDDNKISVNLAPGRIHVFEIDTPEIETYSSDVYRQNL